MTQAERRARTHDADALCSAALEEAPEFSRKLERANREIAERLDAAIGTIRSVLDAGDAS